MRSLVLARGLATLPAMRVCFLSLFLAAAVSALAANIEVVRVWPGLRTAESFERLSEVFGGGENTGGRLVLRTQKDQRAGFYFLVRLNNPEAAVAGCTWTVQVILPDAPKPKTYTLATALPAGGSVYELGLTGKDWPAGLAAPVAWKLTCTTAEGRELVSQQSFLWSK